MGERAAGGVGEEATSQEQSAVLGACGALSVPRYPLGPGDEGRVAEDRKVMWRWRLFKCWQFPAVGFWRELPAGQDSRFLQQASLAQIGDTHIWVRLSISLKKPGDYCTCHLS